MAPPDSESLSKVALPAAEASDSEEVTRALKLAHMLWEEGQHREAVRTLQRGAAAAEEDGNDLRALTLARSAADLAAHLGAVSGSAPPAAGSVPPAAAAPGAFPAPTPAPAEVIAALPISASAPSTTPNPPTTTGAAPVTARSIRPVPASGRKSETPSSTVEVDAPPSSSDFVVPVVIAEPEADAPVASPSPISSSPVTSPLPISSPPPVSTVVASPTTTPNPTLPNSVRPMGRVATAPSIVPERQASKPPARGTNGASGLAFPINARELRVAVKRSALDETLFVVRPLAPGASAPAGSREATLVFSDDSE